MPIPSPEPCEDDIKAPSVLQWLEAPEASSIANGLFWTFGWGSQEKVRFARTFTPHASR